MVEPERELNEPIEPTYNPEEEPAMEPCGRCGVLLSVVPVGCRTFHCPNCGNPYPFGDCSDI